MKSRIKILALGLSFSGDPGRHMRITKPLSEYVFFSRFTTLLVHFVFVPCILFNKTIFTLTLLNIYLCTLHCHIVNCNLTSISLIFGIGYKSNVRMFRHYNIFVWFMEVAHIIQYQMHCVFHLENLLLDHVA